MHSIPPKQFANFSTLCKFRPFKSMAYKGCWNVPTRNRGEGVSFLGKIVPNLGMETPPLCFGNAMGRGYIFLVKKWVKLGMEMGILHFSIQKG